MFCFMVGWALSAVGIAAATPVIGPSPRDPSTDTLPTVDVPVVGLLDDSTLVKRSTWPYLGAFDGTSIRNSCGDELAPGSNDAPPTLDCYNGLARWLGDEDYISSDKLVIRVMNKCALVWYPDFFRSEEVEVSRRDFDNTWVNLFTGCVTGDDGEYISNHAHLYEASQGMYSVFRYYPRTGINFDAMPNPDGVQFDFSVFQSLETPTSLKTEEVQAGPQVVGITEPLNTEDEFTADPEDTTVSLETDDVVVSEDTPGSDETTEVDASTVAPRGEFELMKRGAWPYNGAFDGLTWDNSCGDELAPGSTDAPPVLDCYRALVEWLSRAAGIVWVDRERAWLTEGDCTLVWYPDRGDDDMVYIVSRRDFYNNWVTLFRGCRTGTDGEYISNWAHLGVDSQGMYNVARYPAEDVELEAPPTEITDPGT